MIPRSLWNLFFYRMNYLALLEKESQTAWVQSKTLLKFSFFLPAFWLSSLTLWIQANTLFSVSFLYTLLGGSVHLKALKRETSWVKTKTPYQKVLTKSHVSHRLACWLSWYRIHLQSKRPGFDPWVRTPGGGNGNPLQYLRLENPIDREAWWAMVQRVTKCWTGLSD